MDCTNCGRTFWKKGSFPEGLIKKRLCWRCAKYAQRHRGALPPKEPLRAQVGDSWQLVVRLPRATKVKLQRAAKEAGTASVSEWIRNVIADALDGSR